MKKSHKPLLILGAFFTTSAFITAADYEWSFNNGTLSDSFGNGTMVPVGAATTSIVDTNGGSIPHIGGVPAKVLNVPQFTSQADGFNLGFGASAGNGGSPQYINSYTFIFDLYSPGAGGVYQALFQTNPGNADGNDADWYIHPNGALGIGALGYSPGGTILQDAWYRIAFSTDLAAGRVTYYVNGAQVAQRTGPSLFDGRFALFSNVDAGDDVRLFNEGDTSDIYTHAFYVNSVAFTDRELTLAEVGALGGPNAAGILVPEPGTGVLALLGLAGIVARRRR